MAQGTIQEHWPHVLASCAVLVALVFYTQYSRQPAITAESLLEDVETPEALIEQNKEFSVPEVVQVGQLSHCINKILINCV